MHGVKRLFGWMIPRFDRERFNVSLVSLRKKDLSEETLEAQGIDITYLERSKFDPTTLPALLQDHRSPSRSTSCTCTATAPRPSAGWPARCGGSRRSCTSTPTSPTRRGFRRSPTGCSSRTPTSRSRSRRAPPISSSARGRCRASKVKVVYLGVPLEEFSRARARPRSPRRAASSASAPDEFAIGTITRLHESKGNSYLVDAAARVVGERPGTRGSFWSARGRCSPDLQAQAARLGLGDRFVFAGFRRDVAAALSAFDLSVFPSLWEGTPLTGLRGAGDGEADRRDRRRRPARHPHRRPRRAHRAAAERGRARRQDRLGDRSSRSARALCRRRRARAGAGTTSACSSARWSACTRCCTRCRARRPPRRASGRSRHFFQSAWWVAHSSSVRCWPPRSCTWRSSVGAGWRRASFAHRASPIGGC